MNKSIASAYAATWVAPIVEIAPAPDFTVRDEGTIVLFTAETPEAEDWWLENVEEGITFCGANVVEHRFAQHLLSGICDAGFAVDFS